MKQMLILAACLLWTDAHAGAQTCNADIELAKDSMTRAQRYLKLMGDKEKALSEADDAVNYAKEAIIDCTHSIGRAKSIYKQAVAVHNRIESYETEEEKMKRIRKERGLE